MVLRTAVPTLASVVQAGLRQGVDFPELCMTSKGATPIAVRSALLQFEGSATLKERAKQLLLSTLHAHGMRPELDERLPVPHPLDFDWRFSSSTAEALAVQALFKAGNQAPILLVGVPSVLLAICNRPNRPPIWFASRKNDPITAALVRSASAGIAFIDIDSDLSAIDAVVSIVDPPWYDDIGRWMVRKAASGTSIDGEVWVAGPDALTGLSSAPALAQLEIDPSPFGLQEAVISALLRYDTPPFEMLAFKRNGILNVPPTWRTGRLYRCKRATELPTAAAAPHEGWEELGTDRARVWSRPGEPTTYFEVAESRGLSRLDPERARAALWTSGHRYSFGRWDTRLPSYEQTLHEICAQEAALLNELVTWRGRYGVQKHATAFHPDAHQS